MIVCFLVISLSLSDKIGYGDAVKVAENSKKEIADEQEDDEDEEEEDLDGTEIASKYVRFFSHVEGNLFALFVECGLDRIIKAFVLDHTAIELQFIIPLPSDKLLHKAGFQHAAKFSLQDTRGTFIIKAPARLKNDKEVVYFPSQETPLWVVFKYKIEEEKVQEEAFELKVDLLEKLLKK